MPWFTPKSLAFLSGLARHNRRDWFEAHRPEYEAHLREPMRALIAEMDARFARFAPEITGDPRRSMFRIHRDTRFSKDKSPYKTNAAAWFYHAGAKREVGREAESGSAGFYFHLEPGQSFLGGGFWMPPRTVLTQFRTAMEDNQKAFERIVDDPAMRRRFGKLSEDAMLKRLPRGYSEDHPAARWLRYQSFTLGRKLTDAQVVSTRLPALLEADFERLAPFVRWLNLAIGYPPARRR